MRSVIGTSRRDFAVFVLVVTSSPFARVKVPRTLSQPSSSLTWLRHLSASVSPRRRPVLTSEAEEQVVAGVAGSREQELHLLG